MCLQAAGYSHTSHPTWLFLDLTRCVYMRWNNCAVFLRQACFLIRSWGLVSASEVKVRDCDLDQSLLGSTPTWHSSNIVKRKYMEDLGLGDFWRYKNPLQREYSYCSCPHRSYSHPDYFLVSHSTVSWINNPEIHRTFITDYGPVSFELTTPTPPTRWRFSTSLLADQDFNGTLSKEWTSFRNVSLIPLGNGISSHIPHIRKKENKKNTTNAPICPMSEPKMNN